MDGTVMVHVWDYKKRRKDGEISIANLSDCLENALMTVSSWIDDEEKKK